MHFIAEAFYRRPLEPRSLTYSRGGSAIMMGLLFLAFCGYLINQIYNDYPLIQNSSEQIILDTETPDIEVCAQGSTLTIVKCEAMYYNWTSVGIPNCWQDFFRPGANTDLSKCYVFETKNRYRMIAGVITDNRNALRRLDFYWKIDSMQNITAATIAWPALTLQLYSPKFTPWVPQTIGNSPKQVEIETNIGLGSSRATTYLNHTSAIFYYPQKYREIKPGDVPSILGLQSNYIDIMTLPNNQKDWPIQIDPPPPPPAFNKSLYDGYFSVQLAQSTIDVKTEVRQHTLLASVALAGGCYGVLTTIYILLFGMQRLTPWGLVHHIPVFISKHSHHSDDYDGRRDLELNNNCNTRGDEVFVGGLSCDENNKNIINKKKSTSLIPWFFRSRMRGTNKKKYPSTADELKEAIMAKMIVRKKLLEQRQLNKQTDTTIPDKQYLLNTTTVSNRLTSSSPTLSNELITEEAFSQKIAASSEADELYRAPQSPTVASSSLPTRYNAPTAGSDRRRETSDDITFVLNNYGLRERQQEQRFLPNNTNLELDPGTRELSNRVEELEIILSEYFINTSYFDQLRSRKVTILATSPAAVEENQNHH